jgi:hypothetical protein
MAQPLVHIQSLLVFVRLRRAEFPDDDEFEHRAQAAGRENSEAHAALSVESQTLSILSDAGGAMRTCVQKMKEARSHSTDGMRPLVLTSCVG